MLGNNFPKNKKEKSLKISFYLDKPLRSFMVFDRDQTAPFTDANGDAQTAANDVIRFDHDSDGKPRGVLLEDLVTDDDTLTIPVSDGLYDWWDEDEGYMIGRFRIDSVDGSHRYTLVANAGSSSNTIGMRSDNDGDIRGAVANSSESGSEHVNQIEGKHPIGAFTVMGLSWSNTTGNIDLYSDIGSRKETGKTAPSGMTVINIGGRNGGSDDLDGWLASIEIGSRYIDEPTMRGKMIEAAPLDLVVHIAGQSLSSQLFTASGVKNFVEVAHGIRGGVGIMHPVNCATTGSAACRSSSDSNYWVDNNAGFIDGPALTTAVSQVHNYGGKGDYLIWKLASGDYSSIGSGTTSIEDFGTAVNVIYNRFRDEIGKPNLPVLISPPGGRDEAVTDELELGAQSVRDYYWSLINTPDNNIEFAAESYDLPFVDAVHLTDAGYDDLTERYARRVAALSGETVTGSTVGPRMVSATYSGSVITLTIEHDGGTDFTPTTGIESFTVFVGDTKQTVNSAARASATTVDITCGAALSGEPRVYCAFGLLEGVTQSNLLKDNASISYPLQSGYVVATGV